MKMTFTSNSWHLSRGRIPQKRKVLFSNIISVSSPILVSGRRWEKYVIIQSLWIVSSGNIFSLFFFRCFCLSRDGAWKNRVLEDKFRNFQPWMIFSGSMLIFRGVQNTSKHKKHILQRAWCRWRMITWTLAPLWVAPHKTVAKALECGPPQGRMEGRFYTNPIWSSTSAVDVIGFSSMISIDSQVKEKGDILTDVWDFYGYIITYMSIILERKVKRNQSVWWVPQLQSLEFGWIQSWWFNWIGA